MQVIPDIYLSRALGHRRRRRSMQYAALLATAYILPTQKKHFFSSSIYSAPSIKQVELDFMHSGIATTPEEINKNIVYTPQYFNLDLNRITETAYYPLNHKQNNDPDKIFQKIAPKNPDKAFIFNGIPAIKFKSTPPLSIPPNNREGDKPRYNSGNNKKFKASDDASFDDEVQEALEEAENYNRSTAKEEEGTVNVINLSSEKIKYPVTTENKEDIESTAFFLVSTTNHNFSIADIYNIPLVLEDDSQCRVSLFNAGINLQYNSFNSYLPALTYVDDNIAISKAASISQETPTFALTFVEDEKAVNDNTIKFLTSNNFPFSVNQNNYPLAIYHGSASIKFENSSSTEQAVDIEKSKLDVTSEATNPETEEDAPYYPYTPEENQNNTYNHPLTIPPFSNGSICFKPFTKETSGKNSPNNLSNTISNQFNWSDFISSNLLYSALYAFGVAALYKLSLKSFFNEHLFVDEENLKQKAVKHLNTKPKNKGEDYKKPPQDDTHNDEGDDKDEGDDQSGEDEGDDPKGGDGNKIKITSKQMLTIKLVEAKEEQQAEAEQQTEIIDISEEYLFSLENDELSDSFSLECIPLDDLEDGLEDVDTEVITNVVKQEEQAKQEKLRAKEEAIEAEKKTKEEKRRAAEEATKAEIEANIKKQKETRKKAKKAEQEKERLRKLDEELKQKAIEEKEREKKEKQKAKQIKDEKRKKEAAAKEIAADEDELKSLYKKKEKINKLIKIVKQVITDEEADQENIKDSTKAKEALKNNNFKAIKETEIFLARLNLVKLELENHMVAYNELQIQIDSLTSIIQNIFVGDIESLEELDELIENDREKLEIYRETLAEFAEIEDVDNSLKQNVLVKIINKIIELNEVKKVQALEDIINIINQNIEQLSNVNFENPTLIIEAFNEIVENELRTYRNLNDEDSILNEEIYELVQAAQEINEELTEARAKYVKLNEELIETDSHISSLEAQLELLRKELTEVSRSLDEEIEEASSILINSAEEPLEPIPSPTPLPSPTPTPEENISTPYPSNEDSYLPESFVFTLPFAAPLVHVGLSLFEIVRAEGSSESI